MTYNMLRHVLIGVPTYNKKDYAFSELVTALYAVCKYTDCKVTVLILDNSDDEPTPYEYTKALRRFTDLIFSDLGHVDCLVRHIDSLMPGTLPKDLNPFKKLAITQEKIRQRVAESITAGSDSEPYYSHLLMLESDIIPDKDVVNRLLSYNLPVVGHSYFLYHGNQTKPMNQSSKKGTVLEGKFEFDSLMGSFLKAKPYPVPSDHIGLGCVMIERSVLENINFRYQEKGNLISDSCFYNDLMALGIQPYVDTSKTVKHLSLAI